MLEVFIFFITCIPIFFLIMIVIFTNERVSEYDKIFTNYDIENTDLDNKNIEEFVIELAKDTIVRNIILNGEVKWERAKILDKDKYEKYLIYLEYESQNVFGTYIKKSVIMCIKINKDEKTYSYRKNPICYEINREDNLDDLFIPALYKKEFKWNKVVLDKQSHKEKYRIKNFFKWIGDFFHRVLKAIKTNKKVQIFFAIIIIIVIIFFLNNNKKEDNNTIDYNQYSNNLKSITDTYNISEEVKEQIRTNWNKICGYGTSNIEKVILDITNGWLHIVYTDTINNGLYVYSETTSGYHYGNENFSSTGTFYSYREAYEKMFLIWLNTWPERYKKLTKNEFINLLNEI